MDESHENRYSEQATLHRLEQYEFAKPLSNGGIPITTNDVKRRPSETRQKVICCFCFKTTKYRRKQFIVGFITNIILFALLIGYTFLGSFIFLAIEGDENAPKPKLLPDTHRLISVNRSAIADDKILPSNYFKDIRNKTVENIWEITVSLNILYRENWTSLAALELLKFQDELLNRLNVDLSVRNGDAFKELALGEPLDLQQFEYEWNLALAFFYSLTVLTTIGYGGIVPRTVLGKVMTVLYAVIGIPLTLIYLSCVGAHLSKLARSVFTRALCCCLCSNCGYCCYDEKRMAEKEKRMKLKRQHEEMRRNKSSESLTGKPGDIDKFVKPLDENDDDSDSWPDTDSKVSMHGLSILAPILLCLCAISVYILAGSIILLKIDNISLLNGLFFCFMALTTIGFGDIVPGLNIHLENGVKYYLTDSNIIWFCSCYTLTGLALTAMCFGVIHDEIILRIRHQQKDLATKRNVVKDEVNNEDPFLIIS